MKQDEKRAMMDEREDNENFKMRLEDPNAPVEDRVIPTEINELKLEKISQRVTLISVLIPVLIAIVLVITYLDIKKRVTQTEDTGNIEFQKLSEDLESRFSSLSVRQARLEDAVQKLDDETDRVSAAIQVRFEKLDDAIKKATGNQVLQKDFDAARAGMVKQINEVVSTTNQASQQVAAITQELKNQMDQLNQSIASINGNIAEMEKQVAAVQEDKIDKPAMDLALRLEALKIQNELKSQLDSLQSQIEALGDRITASQKKTSSAASSSTAVPAAKPEQSKPAAATAGSPAKAGGGGSEKIEEQTITK